MDNISKEIEAMLEELGYEEDERLAKISDEDFRKNIEKAEYRLEEKYNEFYERQAEGLREMLNNGTIC